MLRLSINLALTGLALVLLGMLVLLSTTADESVWRHFDASLRQMRPDARTSIHLMRKSVRSVGSTWWAGKQY